MDTDERASAEQIAPARKLGVLQLIKIPVAVIAVIPIAAFAIVAFVRLKYPYELEWLESEMLVHVQRLVSGEPIYGPPTANAVQLPYAPLTFGLTALLGQVFDVDFQLMRVVSILATLVTMWLLYRIVVEETTSRTGGLVAAGIYAASYRIAGTFYDVAKSDALFIMLSVAAIGMARLETKRWHPFAAGALMALAIFAKQSAIFIFFPIALYLLIFRWRKGLVFTGVTTAIVGVFSVLLHAITNGWYTFFVWELLFQHDVEQSAKLGFLEIDLAHYWPMLVLLVLVAPLWLQRQFRWTLGYFVFVIGGLILGSWSARLHTGGYDNVLMPAIVAMALIAGLGSGLAFRITTTRRRDIAQVVAIAVVCVTQIFFLRYDIAEQVPTEADKSAGDAFTTRLAEMPGDVLVLSHPGYALMTGKSDEPGKGGTEDILRGTDKQAQQILLDSFADAIHHQRWKAIVLDDNSTEQVFPSDWKNYYYLSSDQLIPSDSFQPVVNKTGVPRELWLPRADAPVQQR